VRREALRVPKARERRRERLTASSSTRDGRCDGCALHAPPYGGIRAIDLATGKTLWDRPFGSARRNGPFGMPTFIPLEIGTPNNGGRS